MSSPFVDVVKAGRVVTLTMARPQTRNAIASHEDVDDLVGAIEGAGADPEISVLVLTGAGESFSAGGDIRAMHERRGVGALDAPVSTRVNYRRGVQRLPLALAELEIATIAAVNGHAIGLGLDLACLCDIRICVEEAKFAASFVKIGIAPGDGGAWILPRAIGYAAAAEMILTGDPIDAARALHLGLVSRVVPRASLMEEAAAIAARVAANPAQAVRLAKRLLREGQSQRLSDILHLSAAFQALAHETPDHREALGAFLDKRPPVFTGASS